MLKHTTSLCKYIMYVHLLCIYIYHFVCTLTTLYLYTLTYHFLCTLTTLYVHLPLCIYTCHFVCTFTTLIYTYHFVPLYTYLPLCIIHLPLGIYTYHFVCTFTILQFLHTLRWNKVRCIHNIACFLHWLGGWINIVNLYTIRLLFILEFYSFVSNL